MVIDALGLDRDGFLAFIAAERPTYPQLEAWVKAQPGVKLDAESIAALNAAITGYIHADATRQAILAADGLPDSADAAKDAIHLNNLDDWHGFHAALLK